MTRTNIEEKGQTWLQTVRSETAPRPRLQLDTSSAALLVIDMVNYFADPSGRAFLPASEAIVDNVVKLVEGFRAAGAPVIYTRHAHRDASDLGMLGRFFSDYIHDGREESQLIEALSPARGEAVIRKTTYDSFWDTDLVNQLEQTDAKQVVITGVLTHMCCETTARSAFCRGFEVYTVVDAMASTKEDRHINSLLAMADSVAVSMSTQEVLAKCR